MALGRAGGNGTVRDATGGGETGRRNRAGLEVGGIGEWSTAGTGETEVGKVESEVGRTAGRRRWMRVRMEVVGTGYKSERWERL